MVNVSQIARAWMLERIPGEHRAAIRFSLGPDPEGLNAYLLHAGYSRDTAAQLILAHQETQQAQDEA